MTPPPPSPAGPRAAAQAEQAESTRSWRRLEAEVRAQVTAELIAAERTPLPLGAAVAWSDCVFGNTKSLGAVHRVGAGFGPVDVPRTLCGELIPPPKRQIPLSPKLIRALGECRHCAEQYIASAPLILHHEAAD